MPGSLRIGTRGSELALWQTRYVKSLLETRIPGIIIEVLTMKTTGDNILDAPLAKIGDKGLFTKELEVALLDGRIDLAVHSCKDVPTAVPDGLIISTMMEREDVRDVFIAHPQKPYSSFLTLPPRAVVATGSLRRKCQLLHARPDIVIAEIRGNLNTRMKKLEESDWDGMILAKAGVTRLGMIDRITEILPFDLMLPAVGQGALAIEIRSGDAHTAEFLRPLHHTPTASAVNAERALLRHLEGGCQIPIGAYGQIIGDEIRLDAVMGSLDGRQIIRGTNSGSVTNAESIGIELAKDLYKRGGKEILDEIRSQ